MGNDRGTGVESHRWLSDRNATVARNVAHMLPPAGPTVAVVLWFHAGDTPPLADHRRVTEVEFNRTQDRTDAVEVVVRVLGDGDEDGFTQVGSVTLGLPPDHPLDEDWVATTFPRFDGWRVLLAEFLATATRGRMRWRRCSQCDREDPTTDPCPRCRDGVVDWWP